ncbi:WD40 repeat domain-containing protein [Nocardia sp. CA-128927]|uniref:WD40 repeat domain-containing protein n=1 Tax=Nocardia sp. CA-128927 TaxID=3239975 RepID=UPI003D96A529
MLDVHEVAVIGGNDATARVWELASGEELRVLNHSHTVLALACTTMKDRPVAVTGCEDGSIRVWDLATGRQLLCGGGSPGTGAVRAIACTAVGGRSITVVCGD